MIEYNFKIDEELQDLIDTSITIQEKQATYGIAVNRFIRQYYGEDRVEAILNNFIANPSDEHRADFNDLQFCRSSAKAYSKEVLGLN